MPTAEGPSDLPGRVDIIVLSVRLKSGQFESSIEMPTNASPARRDECVRQWLGMMQSGLAMVGADVQTSARWPEDQDADR